MLKLANFPASILDHIIGNRDTSWVIIKLWLSGDRLLNEKLSQGLTYVHLTHRYFGSLKFPRLLFNLRGLRYLAIHSNTNLTEKLDEWPLIMSSLSQSLETLKLELPDALRCLTNYALNASGQAEPVTSNYARGSCKYIDMDRIFPRLHTLSLWHDSTTPRSPLYFAALPSNLTCLNALIQLDYTMPGVSYMSALPRTLLRLEGSLEIEDDPNDDWSSAPPHLEKIPDFAYSDSFDYSWLPKTLRYGQLSFTTIIPFNLSAARSIPSKFPQLSIRSIDDDIYSNSLSTWMQHLPAALKQLRLKLLFEYMISLPFLPRTLVTLSFDGDQSDLRTIIPNASAASNFWPPSLETLKWRPFHHRDIDLLPQSITELAIVLVEDTDDDDDTLVAQIDASLLPPLLKILDIKYCSLIAFSGKFPSNLQDVAVPSSLVENLPDSVTLLNLCRTDELYHPDPSFEITMQRFPTNLTSLILPSWTYDRFNLIPRALRSLEIRHLVGITKSLLIADGRMFESLPVSLTDLKVSGTAPNLPTQRLGHLVQLKRLHLSLTDSLSSSILRELPSSLEDLCLPILKVEDEDAPFIPCRLRSLQLFNYRYDKAAITPALVRYWPLRALGQLVARRLSSELTELLHLRLADPLLSSYSQATRA